MTKIEKTFACFIAILLIFGLYRYKIFKDNQYQKHLTYATNNLYCLNHIQKYLYDDYNNVYKEAIDKKYSFHDIYSNDSHNRIMELNRQRIFCLKRGSIDQYVLERIENPSNKYKNEYTLFLDALDYYTKNLNKFNLDPNSFKESDYDEFIKHFNELNTRLANLMKTLEMPEYDAYFN